MLVSMSAMKETDVPRTRLTRTLAAACAAAVSLALAGCAQLGEPAEQAATPATTAPAEDGTPTNFLDLNVGDCFDIPSNLPPGEALKYSSCDVLHLFEAFATEDLADGEFPGGDAVEEQARAVCEPAFADFVGESWQSSTFDFQFIVPSERTWRENGDRSVMCMVTSLNGLPWAGSAAGKGR